MSLSGTSRGMRAGPAAPADMIADALRRQPCDRVVDAPRPVHREPVAIVGEARRRHHAVVGDGGARVVELHQEAGVDDHLVFGAHRLGDRCRQFFVVLVILVLAVGDHARGRRHRQEGLLDLHAFERGLEVVDVALQLGLAGIGDRADADRIGRWSRRLARVELGIEFGEARAVGAALERVGAPA